ncbi:MAG: M23 family metallopeptidase [Asticcacaulis sp.]
MASSQPLNRRSFLTLSAGASLGLALPASAQTPDFGLHGVFTQGGYAIGQAAPFSELWVNGAFIGRTPVSGWFFVGFDRDASATCTIEIRTDTARKAATLDIAPVSYDIQRVDGLPPQTVTPTEPDVLTRILRESALKKEAFASLYDSDDFKGGFQYPLKKFRISGQFGNQRVLNGVPKSPHMGFDMAAPTGTAIRAPQTGLVVLAEPDMFYEGGLTFIDHGQGLISMYLHQSKVLVKKGDHVKAHQLIGRVGSKGRATGPHLCWRLKWQGQNLNPSLLVQAT